MFVILALIFFVLTVFVSIIIGLLFLNLSKKRYRHESKLNMIFSCSFYGGIFGGTIGFIIGYLIGLEYLKSIAGGWLSTGLVIPEAAFTYLFIILIFWFPGLLTGAILGKNIAIKSD